jgi:pyridinium-3,5-biscarboxylic acid mononucleotide synthase
MRVMTTRDYESKPTMDETTIRQLLDDVRSGALAPDDAVARLRRLPFADLGFARVDHHRALRQGTAEAVYGPGKTPEQCAEIVAELLSDAGSSDLPVLLTRVDDAQADAALARNPGGQRRGRTVVWRPALADRPGRILVLTAGTADLPVAEEALATLEAFGFRPQLLADCGVAGVHRLLASSDELAAADIIIVIAGMEGALASLVGGITAAPVVAVPTSVGYGAALEGVTALLAMLASCASGITVVGIDNGFGAACAVARLLR